MTNIKRIKWLGRSKEMVKSFSGEARAVIGYQLFRVQQGLLPTDWKPMPTVGTGVFEIRVHRPHEHRVVYVSKFEEAVYVLHAFEKKTQKTSKRDIDIAEATYRKLQIIRQGE